MTDIINVTVPGKLFIAGEYAVLEENRRAVVTAVDRYMKGTIEASSQYVLSLPQAGFPHIRFDIRGDAVIFEKPDEKLNFIHDALLLFHRFLREHGIEARPFQLTVTSELDHPSGKKLGLGSSAAIVVTAITALLNFYKGENIRPEKELIYKLSAISHYLTQGNGSCADIAASTYGGWLSYTMFRPDWLLDRLREGTDISDLAEACWPGLSIEQITPPTGLNFIAGWTKEAASTAPMVERVQKLRTTNRPVYRDFLDRSGQAVAALIDSFHRSDLEGAIKSLRDNRNALKELGEYAGVEIETPALKKLITAANRYGSGKSSGAGGGDCGIAFVRNEADIELLKKDWRKQDILPLPVQVSTAGAQPSE